MGDLPVRRRSGVGEGRRAPEPSGAATQIAQRPPTERSNARVDPSRDQLGSTFSPGPSNATCAAEPSTGTTRIEEPVGLSAAIAIELPSGDQTGPTASVPGRVIPVASCRTGAPLAWETASASPSRNAIRSPSGDQAASMPGTRPISRLEPSRTLVDVPVSSSRSPLSGRKPRGIPSPARSTSSPRTLGVNSVSPLSGPGDSRWNASIVAFGDHQGFESRGAALGGVAA